MFRKLILFFLISLIQFYQKKLSPLKPKHINCRFHPTCSHYAILSLKKYGIRKGAIKTLHRLWRCRPDNYESCIDYP
ncbi:membrane protein insertion efficiency factor YidD [Evansella sp. AB-P1]|uniref:membrane protein insertion efficiency factor YidD n=1 Tax=Evansella sp. AB-P1 TaxID=3037653 RepID=UPI00242008D0|nr:membrane protein insertion efficiency factor YidD [Evansella sp. AB-P1]MDG5788868.1 membrane protein insertion efficiency factor YidD [Evansella sp. AB-P1]